MSDPSLLIPGVGWDTESIVWGYIKFAGKGSFDEAPAAIASYPFDEVYPFTNIFCGQSPARYGAGVVGFAGSYKQVEEDWSEWLWKFADLLARLEAIEAHACLDCVLGSFRWTLEPSAGVGRGWVITRAPENDFAVHPEWLARFGRGWTRFVERADGSPP